MKNVQRFSEIEDHRVGVGDFMILSVARLLHGGAIFMPPIGQEDHIIIQPPYKTEDHKSSS